MDTTNEIEVKTKATNEIQEDDNESNDNTKEDSDDKEYQKITKQTLKKTSGNTKSTTSNKSVDIDAHNKMTANSKFLSQVNGDADLSDDERAAQEFINGNISFKKAKRKPRKQKTNDSDDD